MESSLYQRLPPRAREIFARLELQDLERITKRRAADAVIRDLRAKRAKAELLRDQYVKLDQENRLYVERRTGDGQIERVRDLPKIEQCDAEIATLTAQIDKLQPTDPPMMTAARLAKLLAEYPPHTSFAERRVTVSLTPDALAEKRAEVDSLRAEREIIARSTRTHDEVQNAVIGKLRRLAARGAPRVSECFFGGDVHWPMTRLDVRAGGQIVQVVDSLAVLCWLFGPQIEKRVGEMLEAAADPDQALSAEEQAAMLRDLDDQIMRAWREEAELVEAIVAQGGEAYHRPDAPVEAVLGITVIG